MSDQTLATAAEYTISPDPRSSESKVFLGVAPMFGLCFLVIIIPLMKHGEFPRPLFITLAAIFGLASIVGVAYVLRATLRDERAFRTSVRELFPEEGFTNRQLSTLRGGSTAVVTERNSYRTAFDRNTSQHTLYFTPVQQGDQAE